MWISLYFKHVLAQSTAQFRNESFFVRHESLLQFHHFDSIRLHVREKKNQTKNITTPRIVSNSMFGINFVCIFLVARRVFSSSFVLNFNWCRDFVQLSVAHAFLISLPCSSIYSARQRIMVKCAVHTHTHTAKDFWITHSQTSLTCF